MLVEVNMFNVNARLFGRVMWADFAGFWGRWLFGEHGRCKRVDKGGSWGGYGGGCRGG